MNKNKDTVTSSLVFACCVLHNIMIIQYPGVHYGIVDDDEHLRLVPGQWRQGVNLQDME